MDDLASEVPLAICVSEAEDVAKYAEVDHLSAGLLEDLLPGPITLLLNKKTTSDLSTSLNPGVSLLGIRVPDSDFIRAVSRQYGHAIALTSANQARRRKKKKTYTVHPRVRNARARTTFQWRYCHSGKRLSPIHPSAPALHV